jgi:hypothetical protein
MAGIAITITMVTIITDRIIIQIAIIVVIIQTNILHPVIRQGETLTTILNLIFIIIIIIIIIVYQEGKTPQVPIQGMKSIVADRGLLQVMVSIPVNPDE